MMKLFSVAKATLPLQMYVRQSEVMMVVMMIGMIVVRMEPIMMEVKVVRLRTLVTMVVMWNVDLMLWDLCGRGTDRLMGIGGVFMTENKINLIFNSLNI